MLVITFFFIIFQILTLVPHSYLLCHNISAPDHGRIRFGRDNAYYHVICDYGYMLYGKLQVKCNGSDWDAPMPTCLTTMCERPSPPENGRVDCDPGPLTIGTGCVFKCFDGYELSGVSEKRCLSTLKWSGSTVKCTPISSAICPLPPSLIHGTVMGCSSAKLPKESQRCSFRCKDGYNLEGPSYLTCRSNGKLTDEEGNEDIFPKCVRKLSLVSDSHEYGQTQNVQPPRQNQRSRSGPWHSNRQSNDKVPCPHAHSCEQLCFIINGQPVCKCNAGYLINQDRTTCGLNNPCNVNGENGGCKYKCTNINKTAVCSCKDGYTLGTDKKSCIKNSPPVVPVYPPQTCEINNGGCQHECRRTRRSIAECFCHKGYRLHSDGKRCVDIDECLYENLNPCQHYCENTEGSFTCRCKEGFVLIDGHKCEGCKKNSYWSFDLKGCTDCPKNSHTDTDGKLSVRDCVCNSGFTGSPEFRISCEDIDECQKNNFGCSEECVNIPGGAYCICQTGFMLDNDNKTCIDIDECSIKNGGCEGLCINTFGSFICKCPEGFTPSEENQYACNDINECLENNGGCDQKCINYRGGYYCACDEGYRLDSGLKNCSDIQCASLPVPHYTEMKCRNEDGTILPGRLDKYPIGTRCTFNCSRGFKNIKGSNKMKCHKDGNWKGTLPECQSQHCSPLNLPENGDVHPPSCATQGAAVKQKCTFTCRPGYELDGMQVFVCKNNLTWNVEATPVCRPEKVHPTIQCPEDIHAELLPGQNTHNITVPEPVTNMENFAVSPFWVSVGHSIPFPAGVTKVIFTANSETSNKTAKCITTVTVLDNEPPVFKFCPDHIQIEGASAEGERVFWEEPVVSDNVKLEKLFSLSEPNTTLTPGTHYVEYIAVDSSGNVATCSFEVTIIRMNCSDLVDPDHGEANCMDWLFGKLCTPQCDDGYMRDPDAPAYYSCDDSGVWEPSSTISECLQFFPVTSSTCQDGFELKSTAETGEVCVECSSKTVWSPVTKLCEDKVDKWTF